jgi:hypothetical protein
VGREGNSPPCSAEVKSEWSYTTTPPISLRDLDRDNIIVYNFDNLSHT